MDKINHRLIKEAVKKTKAVCNYAERTLIEDIQKQRITYDKIRIQDFTINRSYSIEDFSGKEFSLMLRLINYHDELFRAYIVKRGEAFIMKIVNDQYILFVKVEYHQKILHSKNVSQKDMRDFFKKISATVLTLTSSIINGEVEIVESEPTGNRTGNKSTGSKEGDQEMVLSPSFFKEIHVKGDIPVKGHIRRQRIGKGRTEIKEIEIKPFKRSGYKRRAVKDRLKTLVYRNAA